VVFFLVDLSRGYILFCSCRPQIMSMKGQNCSQWNLNHLPDEVLYHLSSFLDTRTILHSLRLVNKRFYDIFSDYSFWKRRIIGRRGSNCYLQAEVEDLWLILPYLRCPHCNREDLYIVLPYLRCSYCNRSSCVRGNIHSLYRRTTPTS
jgi:hypothetical protein